MKKRPRPSTSAAPRRGSRPSAGVENERAAARGAETGFAAGVEIEEDFDSSDFDSSDFDSSGRFSPRLPQERQRRPPSHVSIRPLLQLSQSSPRRAAPDDAGRG